MTEAPERIWAARGLYDTSPLVRHPTPIEYIRADLARPVTAAEAAKVLLDEWDMHGEGFIGELTCHSSDEFGQMDADLDGEWVRFSEVESVFRTMSRKT